MQFDQLKRREFIALLGGGAVVWPLPPLTASRFLPDPTTLTITFSRLHLAISTHIPSSTFPTYLPLPLAAELVRLNPNVVVSSPVPANLAIAKLTSTIPIVMASGADPVGFGLVKSLSHPGGNVTGLTNFAEELASKQIDLMRELLPGLARLAALVNVANPLHVPQWRETQAAAAQAAIALVPFELRSPDQLEEAFARFARERADALIVPPDVTFTTHRRRIANLALGARLPTIFFVRQSVEDGGLMSYGPNPVENYRRAATYVDKILKGAKPQDLPIERPTNFDLIINLTTAKALGLDVPATLLARADEVIE